MNRAINTNQSVINIVSLWKAILKKKLIYVARFCITKNTHQKLSSHTTEGSWSKVQKIMFLSLLLSGDNLHRLEETKKVMWTIWQLQLPQFYIHLFQVTILRQPSKQWFFPLDESTQSEQRVSMAVKILKDSQEAVLKLQLTGHIFR